ncbi:hypothetical protein D3C78_484020 [compost metagenome]
MKREIAEIRELVGTVASSMEMLSVVASMEDIDSTAVVSANTAIANIASSVGEELPPVLVAEDGEFTTASMESLVNFVKDILIRLKKWIKTKFENMAISFRRGNLYRGTLIKRVHALQARMDSMPNDYGIPSKSPRYDVNYLVQMYNDGNPIPFSAEALGPVCGQIVTLIEKATKDIAPDAVRRSTAIGDVIATILVARDENSAEDSMRKLFKDVTGPLPVEGIAPAGKEFMGVFYKEPAVGRSRYRDAEWIMDLVQMLEFNQMPVSARRSGRYELSMLDLPQLRNVLDVVVDLMENDAVSNMDYFNQLSAAWGDAGDVWERLWQMVTTMEFGHMNNELWRAFDIATTAMFEFLNKAYYHIEDLRAPYFRMMSGSLYILEEQMKSYVAVNR